MVKYNYDAWGNWINKETLGQNKLGNELVNINPFIYKGYIYDEETDFYYLKSRYYSPRLEDLLMFIHFYQIPMIQKILIYLLIVKTILYCILMKMVTVGLLFGKVY